MAAGSEQSVFSFGEHPYNVDKMYPRYIIGGCSNLDELDDDVFHPDDFIFPEQPGDSSMSSVFTQVQSYACLLGRFQLFPLSHCCGPGVKQTDHEDKATQTQCPSSPTNDIMLPCGVSMEPQRLFYGNAGFRLHFRGNLERNLHPPGLPHPVQQAMTAEVQIARKLQRIGDQFHRHHLQMGQEHRNNIWRRIYVFIRNLA